MTARPFTFHPIKDRFTLDPERVKLKATYSDPDGSRGYDVHVDGEYLGEVRRVRAPSRGHASRKVTPNTSAWGVGHWGWECDGGQESDYETRAQAVADAIIHKAEHPGKEKR